jgi:hypothetical protein
VDAAALVGGIVLFSWLHNRLGHDAAAATDNARLLQSAERWLGVDVGLSANQWLAEHPTLAQASVFYYRLYYLPVLGTLVWVLLRHRTVFLRVARMLVAMAVLALLVFWWAPMSPPRFALPGIVDVVAQGDLFGSTASRDLTNGRNHYSAMPSLHVGWSLLCAYAAWSVLRLGSPRLALLPWLFPALMIAVVIGTGNHYVLDIVGSVLLLVVSLGAATLWETVVSGRARRAGHRE